LIKKILIIGGNGFLGFNTAKALSKLNFKLVLLCKKRKKSLEIKGIKYIYCDITNYQKLKKKINIKKDKIDCVINFSGNINHSNKKENYKVHFIAFKHLLNIFKKKDLKLFIQAGSSAEYGNCASPQKEKAKCKPNSSYGLAKYSASKLLINKNYFKFVILRLYQVFGPYQKIDRLVPFTINSCLKGKPFNCTEGNQKRDFLFVEDLTNLIIKIVKKKNFNSGIFNVGQGKPVSVRYVVKNIKKNIQKGKPIFGGIEMRKDENKLLYPNIYNAKKTFNWSPNTSFKKGIKKTIKFYKHLHLNNKGV
tara:strand:+ start:431 stop:1348 length:918 start_codon:yes stop_codon:yes gene_type:complete